LEKEKIELENQSKEYFGQIEKLTSNYVNIILINNTGRLSITLTLISSKHLKL